MHTPPIGQAEIDARVAAHVDELLELWRAEQGAGKPRDLDLMALIMPFPRDETVSLLDLGCGPGDFGRAVRQVYPNARIDGIDRDPFLTSICKAVSQRDGTPGRLIVRDLYDNTWSSGLPNDYHAVAMVNALHWFDVAAAERLLRDVYAILRDGGVFLLAEPTSPERPFSNGFEAWKATQPARYSRENWERFWSRARRVAPPRRSNEWAKW